VLTARVLRLLLAEVDPSSILCLTFTKAGAAEMAQRLQARLAYWVRLKDNELGGELSALGIEPGEGNRNLARTLFARVLDASGGGLRIQTIHAFAQSLLAGFPAEAELTPGFRAVEGREEQMLRRETLAALLVDAQSSGDLGFIRDVQALSYRLGERGAEEFLRHCAQAGEGLEALGPREGIEARLRRAFDIPAGDIESAIAEACCDDAFDVACLRRIAALNRAWGGRNGTQRADLCERWLAADPAARSTLLETLHSVWATGKLELRSFGRGQAPQDSDYEALATAAFGTCSRLLALRRSAALVATLAAGLRAGQTFARAYAGAKRAAGLVDFNDLIRSAERLLRTPGMGDWVRYKLDQTIDHILVDEAQDTNERQWSIIAALTEEFFAGEGASDDPRTIFLVGDFKQAIFGFQGTDPQEFEDARQNYIEAAAAIDAAFLDLSMDLSFRSAPPILQHVDRLLGEKGHASFGIPEPPNRHEAYHSGRAGSVTIWKPSAGDVGEADEDLGEEGWISDSVRRYAQKVARQVREWLDSPFEVGSKRRPVRPDDILILVRRRSQLAALIVARLHAEGVPVAGIDRLLLSAPLAVQDLLAAMRFAAQPLDDLNLAALLVSPLFGWSQDELFEVAADRSGPLWPRLRERSGDKRFAGTVAGLGELLGIADLATPHEFLETILSGALDGRRKLLGRLGAEARDPMEELLSSALEFETRTAPSLQRFLDWFARGEIEIQRDPSAPLGAVRVMTVHGAKGLQAPVVILADACGNPDRRGGGIAGNFATVALDRGGPRLPIFRPRKDELIEPLKSQLEAQDAREREEYWRLLYVALTRAEERLFVGGALGPADRNGPAPESWHRAVEAALGADGCGWQSDPLWGEVMTFGDPLKPAKAPAAPPSISPDVPSWARIAAPVETRPPRPLAPSALGEFDQPEPPPGPAMRAAAERGRLLHSLFERLPAIAGDDRAERADRWLAGSAGVADPELRKTLVNDACAIVGHPDFADIFSPEAFAEAPIAAVTPDGTVVTGVVDRLLVTPDRVRLVDFKTGRRVPGSADEVPVPHVRQIAAYVSALEIIFPGRAIDAALLYTNGPALVALTRERLDPYMPGAPANS